MSSSENWNAAIIDEFRADEGRVGGQFDGIPLVLLHHRGRKSGTEFVSPVAYLAEDTDPATIYIFASKAGAPINPGWYHNLVAAGRGEVERGTERYDVTVTEVTGAERDRIYAIQVGLVPTFADYEQKTEGVRTIPVLALRRA